MVPSLIVLSKTALTFSAILAVFSIPASYAFGMTIPFMGSGLEAFIDSTFITKELYRLFVFSIGVFAYFRVIFSLFFNWIMDAYAWSADATNRYKVYVFNLFLLLNLLFLFLAASIAFIGWSVFLSFFFSCWLLAALAMVGSSSLRKSTMLMDHGHIDFQKLKALLLAPSVHYAIVTALLLFSINLGYHRVVALAVGKPVCVITAESRQEAAVVGLTERGILVAFTKDQDWVPLTLPMGLALLDPNVFAFISSDVIEQVDAVCNERENTL